VLVQGAEDVDRLLHLQRWPHVGDLGPAVHLAPGDRHDDFGHVGLGPLQQNQAQATVDLNVLTPVEGVDQLLGRVTQPDVGEAEIVNGHLGPAVVVMSG
jgi:hypothetical protein